MHFELLERHGRPEPQSTFGVAAWQIVILILTLLGGTDFTYPEHPRTSEMLDSPRLTMGHPIFHDDFKWLVNGFSNARPTTLNLMEESHLARWDQAMRLGRGAHWGKALEAYQLLRRRGLRNSLSIHNSVMHSCAAEQHWKLDWISDSGTMTVLFSEVAFARNWLLIKYDEACMFCMCHKSYIPCTSILFKILVWKYTVHSTYRSKRLNIWFNTPFDKYSKCIHIFMQASN